MDIIPPEIACHIGSFCDFKSLVHLLAVDHKWRAVSLYLLHHRRSIDFQQDIEASLPGKSSSSDCPNTESLSFFLSDHTPNVRKLSLNGTKTRLTCCDLIVIARSLPDLQVLEIEQAEHGTTVAYDGLYSLCFFKNLKELSLRGWNQFNLTGRGSAYRSTLPYSHFLHLESLKLHNTPTVLDFLANYSSYASRMERLKAVELTFTEHCADVVPLLIAFILNHPSLESVVLENVRVADGQDVERFLRSFLHLDCLQELQLNNFELPASLDAGIVKRFVETMGRRKVYLVVR